MPGASTISVIIPTLGRPQLVLRAVKSALAQTYTDIETIVVVDGPDQETITALQSVSDPRLKTIVSGRSMQAAGARNLGAAHATGHWIAFLDDDDEWLPKKLELQLAVATTRELGLVTCLSQIKTPRGNFVWPMIIYDNDVPIDEYLFDRRTMFSGASFIQTSSYLIPRELYQRVPFRTDTPHDDWDFLLRLSKRFGAHICTVPEVLVRVYAEEPRLSLSRVDTWEVSINWLEDVAPLLTRRSYSGFCLGVVGSRAANERAYSALFPLLRRAFKNGSPSLLHVLTFAAFWLMPQDFRRYVRAKLRAQ